MRVLGIDPGIGRMGVGIVDKAGSRLTSPHYELLETPSIPVPDRLMLLSEGLERVLKDFEPQLLVIEKVIFAANKTTAFDVAKAAGVAMLIAGKAGLKVHEITPAEVKQAVVGVGNADKRQVQFMVTKLLGLEKPPRPDDVADALALGIAGALAFRV